MGNVTGLFMVDISNNYDAWSISSETFNAMTNLEELHMKDCCSNINEEITPELFRDLVNLEFLDISSTGMIKVEVVFSQNLKPLLERFKSQIINN